MDLPTGRAIDCDNDLGPDWGYIGGRLSSDDWPVTQSDARRALPSSPVERRLRSAAVLQPSPTAVRGRVALHNSVLVEAQHEAHCDRDVVGVALHEVAQLPVGTDDDLLAEVLRRHVFCRVVCDDDVVQHAAALDTG